MRNQCLSVFLLVAFLGSIVLGADTPSATAIKADAAPVLDGQLDDAVWQQGSWYANFSRINRPDAAALVQTSFKVAIDSSAIYFAVRANEPHLAGLVKTDDERDGKIYKGDVIEFTLGADLTGEQYVHFIIDTRGVVYDAERFDRGNQFRHGWNGSIATAIGMEEKAWTIEASIPLSELGISTNIDTWLFNIGRQRYADGKMHLEQSTFAPLIVGFHRSDSFVPLHLPKLDLSLFQWKVAVPTNYQFSSREGTLHCSAQAEIENQTGQARSFVLRPRWAMGDTKAMYGSSVAVKLDSGQSRPINFDFPVLREGKGMLVVELRDAEKPEAVWAVRQFETTLKYEPVKIEVRKPYYRNNIYATEALREIQAQVHLAVEPERQSGARLSVSFAPKNDPAVSVAEASFDVTGSKVAVVLPIPALKTGSYELKAVLWNGNEAVAQSTTTINKLSRVDHEWRFNENNVLLHNGEPFLAFGWFSPPVELMQEPDCPFNAAQQYGAYKLSIKELREFLDLYAAAGKYVAIDPFLTKEMFAAASVWSKPLSKEEAKMIRERVRAIKDHPAILAWNVAEEPECRKALDTRSRQIFEVIADEDPFHPCIMLNNSVTGIYTYVDGGDILMPDPYPQFFQNGLAANPMEKVATFVKACYEASAGKKALWLCPQAFNYNDMIKCNKENNRAPTFGEFRNMVYQGVVYGVTGFLPYIHRASHHYMSLQVGVPAVAREVADLKEAVLAPDAGDVLEIHADQPEQIHTSVRRVGDVVYVFAVNTATKKQNVRFGFKDGVTSPGRLYVVSEDRSVPVDDDQFSDHFEYYDTHIYVSDEQIAKRETLAEVHAEIAKRDAARKKPGNLAFEDSGIKVTACSEIDIKTTTNKLFDGTTGGRGWRDGTPSEFPDWIEVAWPKAVEFNRVVVASETAAEIAVLVPDQDGGWKQVAVTKRIADPEATLRFPTVKSDRFRVEVRKNRRGESSTTIAEIEAYLD